VDSFTVARSGPRLALVEEGFRTQLSEGNLEKVPPDQWGRGLYALFFAVPKSTGKARACYDFRRMNQSLVVPHFKMEGLHTVRALLRRDDFMTSIDIRSAFPHLAIDPDHRQYFRFVWRGVHYQYKAMCFGLATAPLLWTKLMKPILAHVRSRGIRITAYLDDLLIMSSSREQAIRDTAFVRSLLVDLGLSINDEKSEFTPSRVREFLGFTIDSHLLQLRLPSKKVSALRRAACTSHAAAVAGTLTLRQLACFMGKANAVTPCVLPGLLHLRELQFARATALRLPLGHWDLPVELPPAALRELAWWRDELLDWNGRSVIESHHPQEVVTHDAMERGWGAWLARPGSQPLTAAGFWSPDAAALSQNNRELRGALMALYSFRRELAGKVVQFRSDNSTVVSYLNKMGGRTPLLFDLAKEFWSWCLATRTTVFATHIPGVENDLADRLSCRRRDRNDWMLDPAEFREIDATWGPHTVDLFATHHNAQLPRFASLMADPRATFVDAFSVDLLRERGYANPPFLLIGRLLAHVRRLRATLTMIVPAWPSQPWWPMLGEMLVARPRLLLPRRDLFLPGHLGNRVPLGAPKWPALAVRISGAPSSIRAFRRRLRLSLRPDGSRPRRSPTTPPGGSGCIFVPDVGLIPYA